MLISPGNRYSCRKTRRRPVGSAYRQRRVIWFQAPVGLVHAGLSLPINVCDGIAGMSSNIAPQLPRPSYAPQKDSGAGRVGFGGGERSGQRYRTGVVDGTCSSKDVGGLIGVRTARHHDHRTSNVGRAGGTRAEVGCLDAVEAESRVQVAAARLE